MINRIKYFIPFFIFVIISLFFYFGLKNTNDFVAVPSKFIGEKIPYFSTTKLSNYPSFNYSDIGNGNVVVLNVFASWCVECLAEHSQLKKLSKTNNIYGLAWKDNPEDTINWLKKYGNVYSKLSSDYSGDSGIDIGVYSVPETFIFNKKGNLEYRHLGAITEYDLQNKILPLIEKLNSESN